jgi:predicted aspartyl protease
MKNAWRRLALIAVIPTVMVLVFPHRTIADDPGGCFMVTSSGKTVSLGSLCGITALDNGVFRIPIKRRFGKTPVIEVMFNGNKTFEMILDTGASGTVITQNMASDLKLKATGTMQAQIADGSQVQFLTGQVKSIAVGGAIVNNVEVAIAPKAGIGLLGHDFFDSYDVRILQKVVEFHRR